MEGIIIYVSSNQIKVRLTNKKGSIIIEPKLTPSGVKTKLK